MQSQFSALQRNFGAPLIQALKPYVQTGILLLDGWKNAATGLGDAIATQLKEGFAAIQAGTGLEWAGGRLKTGLKVALDWFNSAWGTTTELIGRSMSEIWEGASNKDVVSGISDGLRSAALTFKSLMLETMAEISMALGGGLASMNAKLPKWLRCDTTGISIAATQPAVDLQTGSNSARTEAADYAYTSEQSLSAGMKQLPGIVKSAFVGLEVPAFEEFADFIKTQFTKIQDAAAAVGNNSTEIKASGMPSRMPPQLLLRLLLVENLRQIPLRSEGCSWE